ncbi:MAG TPA: ribonucleoside hydrolase [Firmicutes bacterium]|nr:ribonucleoside hydrolase [Bacillota bacterium]
MEKRKIILDSDPGHDDAVAIMLALSNEKLDLLAIAVEAGNQTLEKTGRNTLNLVEYFNVDIPVALGESHPLKKKLETCPKIHGESGLDGFNFPKTKRQFDNLSAVELMRKILLENDKVTLVPTGPLTNIAILLTKYPEVKPHIEEIVLMGGSIGFGNVTPAAEFNIFVDPEAADIVFRSGLVIKMMGLDVTRKVKLTFDMLNDFRKISNKASVLFCDLMKVFIDNQKNVFGFEGAPLHDPVTIAYLIDPSVVTLKEMNTEIDVSGGPSYGRTNCDQFNYLNRKPNSFVAIDIDINKYWKIIKNGLENF